MRQEVAPTAIAMRASARLASLASSPVRPKYCDANSHPWRKERGMDRAPSGMDGAPGLRNAKIVRIARGAARPASSNQRHWAGNQ